MIYCDQIGKIKTSVTECVFGPKFNDQNCVLPFKILFLKNSLLLFFHTSAPKWVSNLPHHQE